MENRNIDSLFFNESVQILRDYTSTHREIADIDNRIRDSYPDFQTAIYSSHFKEETSINEKITVCDHLTPFVITAEDNKKHQLLYSVLRKRKEELRMIPVPQVPSFFGKTLFEDQITSYKDHPDWDRYWEITQTYSFNYDFIFEQLKTQTISHIRSLAKSRALLLTYHNPNIRKIIRKISSEAAKYITLYERAYTILHSFWALIIICAIIDTFLLLGFDLTFWIEKQTSIETGSFFWGEVSVVTGVLLSMALVIATYMIGIKVMKKCVKWLFIRNSR